MKKNGLNQAHSWIASDLQVNSDFHPGHPLLYPKKLSPDYLGTSRNSFLVVSRCYFHGPPPDTGQSRRSSGIYPAKVDLRTPLAGTIDRGSDSISAAVQDLETYMRTCGVTGLSCAQACVKVISHLPPVFAILLVEEPWAATLSQVRLLPSVLSQRHSGQFHLDFPPLESSYKWRLCPDSIGSKTRPPS